MKERTGFACADCEHRTTRWSGRCPHCGAWGSMQEKSHIPSAATYPAPSLLTPEGDPQRTSTGIDGLDRILGGGVVQGSVVLLAGEPGIGKSTLLLQALAGSVERGSR